MGDNIMQWHHLALSADQVCAGTLIRVVDEFTAAFRAAGGPRTMALFQRGADNGALDLFFTPDCAIHARRVMEGCGAAPCAAPPLAGLDLLVGHNEITYYLTT
jgi:hypothetical protein